MTKLKNAYFDWYGLLRISVPDGADDVNHDDDDSSTDDDDVGDADDDDGDDDCVVIV